MVQNPKYDNDAVNLGYLNKRLKQSEKDITTDNNNSISKIPKNYSIPPNPPYYKDSLLCYKNKIYKCNTTKLSGVFSWNDWSIAATDDTTVSDFINNIYELEKLEIQEQIDGKIQTYYQETDPSNEWKTDLEKAKHIGDYWYNTTNNTQWRYNRNTDTTPITYGWGQVNVPNSVFDLIDKKKSIYTIKPTSYKKDDLWIIEDTLSNEDLPTGTEENPIAKGDWVFSVANSDTYNKEHWVKRDEDVSLSYLEQHYYTMGDIDSSFEELERSTDSKITKAKEEINLNVSQKYTTIEAHKAAINNFDEQIGTINNTIKTHETNISDLNVGVGKISASVESVKSKTEELSVDIDGVKENIIPTSTVSGPNIHIEDASDKKMVNFEIEGKSEQATRSGKNLFNIELVEKGKFYDSDGSLLNFTNSFGKKIVVSANEKYGLYIKNNYSNSIRVYSFIFDENNNRLKSIFWGDKLSTNYRFLTTITIPENAKYLTISILDIPQDNIKDIDIQLEKDAFTNYEPYGVSPSPDYPSEIESVGTYNEETGKYEIEVKNIGKNLFDNDNANHYSTDGSGNTITTSRFKSTDYIPCKSGESFTISGIPTTISDYNFKVVFFDSNKNYISRPIAQKGSMNVRASFSITAPNNAKYVMAQFYNTIEDGQFEKGSTATDYEEYKSNSTLFTLNQPLRSLPNRVRDIAYIKNNILYVDRKVGTVVLNGSEGWTLYTECSNETFKTFSLKVANGKKLKPIKCSHFVVKTGVYNQFLGKEECCYAGSYTGTLGIYISIESEIASTVDEFKNWLSTHNTQVDYELAEPYTEKIGEVEIPSTFKGVNNITTTDELEPVMNIEYVRDTILSDYVEGQVGNAVAIQERKNAEFQITNEEIKSSVSNISTDLDGTKSSLNSVEEKITSQEKTINIISKNIDGTTGDIREVTTTTGFTFNAEGMAIDDGAGYKAQHTAQGTFYKDGDSITGQYTKDGSKQKDLELFGTYSYGKNDINDTPMFVAQLYTDEKGEECFGHFYNGGDY